MPQRNKRIQIHPERISPPPQATLEPNCNSPGFEQLAIATNCKYIVFMSLQTTYWIELSDYDFETAQAMLESRRYLYVGFMCHQTIEKAFKALYSKQLSETAPFTHSLSLIAKRGGFWEQFFEFQKEFIDQLEPLNIETRYPLHKERLLKSLTESKCKELLTMTEEMQKWIKQKL